ncbi:hypothetical protein BSL78_19393 [Apostichopus japonicus]|uniref:Uncharacterized protein n=1 Tax=Stichopus japonicus TaxID=307972 RepID=A0A2G8K6X2_STIJA|nr:hypothetical protein BSL78_19393 [Apostichopus japonicus]
MLVYILDVICRHGRATVGPCVHQEKTGCCICMHQGHNPCFAYEQHHYGVICHLFSNDEMPVDNPEVYDYFMKGGFSVQIGSTNPFGRIPVDQTTEETVNKDTETSGGTKGFSLKPEAIRRYYHTAEYRSMYLRQLREMTGLGGANFDHADLHQPRIQKDEKDIRSVLDLVENSWDQSI